MFITKIVVYRRKILKPLRDVLPSASTWDFDPFHHTQHPHPLPLDFLLRCLVIRCEKQLQ